MNDKCDCGGTIAARPDAHLECPKCKWVSEFVYYRREGRPGIFMTKPIFDVVRSAP